MLTAIYIEIRFFASYGYDVTCITSSLKKLLKKYHCQMDLNCYKSDQNPINVFTISFRNDCHLTIKIKGAERLEFVHGCNFCSADRSQNRLVTFLPWF